MPLGKTQKKSVLSMLGSHIFLALILIISRTYEPLTNFLKSVSFNFKIYLMKKKLVLVSNFIFTRWNTNDGMSGNFYFT